MLVTGSISQTTDFSQVVEAMEFHAMTLVSRSCEYDDVHTFHFRPAEGKSIPYEAGMFTHLVSQAQASRETVRHMSFASAPSDDVISFSMDVASDTPFKKAMSELQTGSQCSMFKIKFKHFAPAWPAEGRPEVVFLGGGVGMSPIRSLIRQHGTSIDWSLVQVARDGKYLYNQEFAAYTAPQVRTDHAGAAAAVVDAVAKKPGAWYYVCGSDRFMRGMLTLLAEAGVLDNKIRVESFN